VPDQLAATIAAAKAADVVVLVLGLNAKITNMEGQDREHDQAGYALPGEQVTLARKIAALGKPTVAVVLSGMAVGMDFLAQQSRENSANPVSILVPGFGGRFGSEALAEALFGKFSPSGRLGYTVSHGRSKQCSAGAPTDAGTFEAG
jgi:beta-glucosidase